MPEIIAQGLIDKLRRVELKLKEVIESELLNLAETMKNDIVSATAMSYSPTWQSAKDWKGKPYFEVHKGLLQKIDQSPIGLDNSSNTIMVGFGHIETLDQLTVSDTSSGKGFPYWRLFEYGAPGSRQGGSSNYSFFTPMRGSKSGGFEKSNQYGRRGEGYMVPSTKKLHKGVLPVHLFGDTLNWYKPKIAKELGVKVKQAIRTI